jgi:probable F420-dependent oxidoreductase
MKFTLAVALSPPEQYGPLAEAAEEAGWDAICVPDSIFWSESMSAKYPYTRDGERFWGPDTPFLSPWIAISWMAAQTESLFFYTNVLKLAVREPLLVAKQVTSLATLCDNRLGFGAGLGWLPEEFEWCGADYKTRGKRANEALEILKLLFEGGEVSYDGEYYSFGKIVMSPTPSQPVPIYIGGHSKPALRRAAKYGDGWASAMIGTDELLQIVQKLRELRKEYGREDEPFEIQTAIRDVFDLDGYKRLEDGGVTDVIAQPWMLRGVAPNGPVEEKIDALRWYADKFIHPMKEPS